MNRINRIILLALSVLLMVSCSKETQEVNKTDKYQEISDYINSHGVETTRSKVYKMMHSSEYQKDDVTYSMIDLTGLLSYYGNSIYDAPAIQPSFAVYQQDITGGGNHIGQESRVDGVDFFDTQTQAVNVDTSLYVFEWRWGNEPYFEAFNPQVSEFGFSCSGVVPVWHRITHLESGAMFERMMWVYIGYANSKIPSCSFDGAPCQFCVFNQEYYPDVDVYQEYASIPYDLNGDGTVNSGDLSILLANFGV